MLKILFHFWTVTIKECEVSNNILASSHVGGRLVCLIQINDLAWKNSLIANCNQTNAYNSTVYFHNATLLLSAVLTNGDYFYSTVKPGSREPFGKLKNQKSLDAQYLAGDFEFLGNEKFSIIPGNSLFRFPLKLGSTVYSMHNCFYSIIDSGAYTLFHDFFLFLGTQATREPLGLCFLRGGGGGAISFLSSSRFFECKIIFADELFGVFCNLWNLLEYFGILWVP